MPILDPMEEEKKRQKWTNDMAVTAPLVGKTPQQVGLTPSAFTPADTGQPQTYLPPANPSGGIATNSAGAASIITPTGQTFSNVGKTAMQSQAEAQANNDMLFQQRLAQLQSRRPWGRHPLPRKTPILLPIPLPRASSKPKTCCSPIAVPSTRLTGFLTAGIGDRRDSRGSQEDTARATPRTRRCPYA